jgi:hypothetical protein
VLRAGCLEGYIPRAEWESGISWSWGSAGESQAQCAAPFARTLACSVYGPLGGLRSNGTDRFHIQCSPATRPPASDRICRAKVGDRSGRGRNAASRPLRHRDGRSR